MFIFSMLIFGTIGIFRKNLRLSSAFIACTRGILGGLFILAFTAIKRKTVRIELSGRMILRLAVTGAIMGVNWILLFEAYNYTTVAVATLCYYMQPTIVMLLSPLLFSEKLAGNKAVCALISIIGMVLVSGVVNSGNTESPNMQGVFLGLGAAVCYAVVVIMNKKTGGADAYQKTIIQLLAAGTAMIPYLLLSGGFSGEGFSAGAVVLLLVIGLVHTGIAYVLYFGSMDGLTAQSIAIFSYIDPVSALLFSALLLREPLGITGMIGAILIIGSAVISEMHIGKR